MNIKEKALQKITELQSIYTEKDKQFWIAEQIKDIASESEENSEHIFNDIDDKEMSIAKIETQIAAYAKKHGGCCPLNPAEDIIRNFFGLSEKVRNIRPDDDLNLENFL